MRNDLTIYDKVADQWWSCDMRWVWTLQNLAPGRLSWMDRQVDWAGRNVLDLCCAGGFMAEALDNRGATDPGINPTAGAIAAARAHAARSGRSIRYDIGMCKALTYADASFDAVVCVDVLEHVQDLPFALSQVARTLRSGDVFLFDTINRNPLARLVTITLVEDILRLLPKGTHDPAMFISPPEMTAGMRVSGLVRGPVASTSGWT